MAHVNLTCKNHPNLRWNCKEEAVNPKGNNGRGCYTGARRIFFNGDIVDECECSADDLILAPESALVHIVNFDSEE